MATSKVRSSNQVFVDEDFDAMTHKIKNLVAGTTAGHAVEFAQLNTAIGAAVNPLLATIHAPVADITAAKAVVSAARANAQLMFVESLGLYWYDADNASASNDDSFIRPGDIASDLTVGRWVKHFQTKLYQPNGTNPFVYTDNSGQLHIDGNIVQSGTNYITHAEHVYTTKDLIILREGATASLATGAFAGFQATKYDGENDGYLVFDKDGVARVGDVGSQQPLTTRIETPTAGYYAIWDAENLRLNFAAAALAAIGNGSAQYQIPITGATTFTPGWTTAANLVGASGLNALSYSAASFVKMTAANTFALRTLAETLSDINAVSATGSAQYQIPVTGATTFTSSWTTAANLVGASGLNALSYSAASFVKMTAANTFALRTLAETLSDLGAAPTIHTHSLLSITSGWDNATLASAYDLGFQTSFVSYAQGFPEFGSVLMVKTYSTGGGSLQLYAPYSSAYGGSSLKYRTSLYDNVTNPWSAWKTLIDGTGNVGYLPSWTGVGTLGDSPLYVYGSTNVKIVGTNKLIFGTGLLDDYQSISGQVSGTDLSFRTYSDYVFYTTTGNGTAGTEKLRITQAGAATFASTIQATTGKFTNLTDGYIPYHVSDVAGLANSPIYTDGTSVGLGTSAPVAIVDILSSANHHFTIGATTGRTTGDLYSFDYYTGDVRTIENYKQGVGYQNMALAAGGGYVGIGTTSPATWLEVSGPYIGSNGQFRITGTSGDYIAQNFYESTTQKANLFYNVANSTFAIQNINNGAYGHLLLNASGGNVCIGTTTSLYHKLAVSSSDFRVASFNSTYGQMNVDFLNNGIMFASIGSGISQTSDVGITSSDFGIGTGGSATNRILFATGAGYSVRMLIAANGNVTMTDLAGTGNRSVYVDAAGKLIASATGSGLAGNRVYRAVPTGTVNGTNPTFTITGVLIVTGSEEVFINGQLKNVGADNDYTITTGSGNTIVTFMTGAIPKTGDVVLINYTPQ